MPMYEQGVIPSSTFANLPLASQSAGLVYRVTDYNNVLAMSNGTYWIALGGQMAGHSAGPVSGAADTNENILGTISLPGSGGLLGLNGTLWIQAHWIFTGSANNKTLRKRLGGIGGTQFHTTSSTFSSGTAYTTNIFVTNQNALNSQRGMWATGVVIPGTTTAAPTAAVDMASATTLVLTGQKASGGETLTLDHWFAMFLPGA